MAAGEEECKVELGYVAMLAVAELGDSHFDYDARNSKMLEIINESGSFPEPCEGYLLSEMSPWMAYAGSLASYCKGIDPYTQVDVYEDLGGRPLGEWLAEYQVTCPLVG